MRLLFSTLIVFCSFALSLGKSPYISTVYEFCPAPGQYVNDAPEYQPGDSEKDMLAKVEENLVGEKQPGLISLGAFGGYVVFGFDHPVVNVPGDYDFKIYGNAFDSASASSGGASEPGIVMVMRDDNENGLPDDTWYELAGSEHSNESTIRNYSITYYRPDSEKTPDPDPVNKSIIDRTYIRWTSAAG